MTSLSPQPSPTKPKAANIVRKIFTGVDRTDDASHQQRWSRQPAGAAPTAAQPPNVGHGRVRSMVKGYEAASLTPASSPYDGLASPTSPSSPTRPQSIQSPPPSRDAQTAYPSTSTSPTVPAAFFQNQQARRTPQERSSSKPPPAQPGKENRQVREGSPPRQFAPSKPQPRVHNVEQPQLQPRQHSHHSERSVSSVGASEGGGSSATGGTSLVSAENAQVGVARVVQRGPTIAPPRIMATAPTPANSTPVKGQVNALPPKSNFLEALPLSFPSTLRPECPSQVQQFPNHYQGLPLEEERPPPPLEKGEKKGRKRALTLGSQKSGSPQTTTEPVFESPEEKQRRIEREFELLLDTMQLPSQAVRTKMLSVTLKVKEDMLASSTISARPSHSRSHSQGNINLSASVGPGAMPPLDGPVSKKERSSKPFLRKTKSSSSLKGKVEDIRPPSRSGHTRTASASSLFKSFGRSSGASAAAGEGEWEKEDASWWAVMMRTSKNESLDVKEVGRLRGRLRGETPKWIDEFLKHGGYTGLLERLKQVLDVEWREEQHDDQLLHELLKCMKALTLTSLLVELIFALFDITPPTATAVSKADWSATMSVTANSSSSDSGSGSGGLRRYMRAMKGGDDEEDSRVLTARAHELVWSLMLGPPNEKEEAKVDFIQEAHRPRIFKTWVTEIQDCVRDYFWIFCHAQNIFWCYERLNPEQIEAPKVPGGMTGGVEFEAMEYATAHFKLINAIARTCPTAEDAFNFHNHLFESGIERTILILRRASQTYYQNLHLELARYLSLARSVRFNLGPRVLSCLDPSTLSEPELRVIRAFEIRNRGPQIGELAFE
ncbi:hypothetical protein MNV49_000165 [Pseudohyphozyma bogoriensis]|nr:hypothetical protein MNV49_000165 [Pseudohyphozyma bogoriensis]